MADALVSVVLEQLSLLIAQKVQKEVGLVAGVKNEVRKLESNFQAIQAVLADAEQRQLKEESIKRWMGQLKDVSYDMDDVLDEWSTAIAKSQMKVNDEHPRKTIKKVCSFMIFSCFRFREVGLCFPVARKIQTLNARIDGIVTEKKTFNFKLSEGETKLPERKITASVIDATEINGREKDKGTIVKMLMSESSDQEPALRTISLVGMGGIGKTTLAQLVYNDHQVETHFGKRIWVCVSDPFDETRIAKAILEALTGSAQNLIELQALLEKIQESIGGKRFLLVLDDVWNEDSTKWEQLKNSLKRGCLPGSRFLVTTRNTKVANTMGSSSIDILELGLLSPDECWSLFSQFAFFEKNSRERENLEETGRKIAERCKGLPLAAKTLGSLLRFKRSTADWESVLTSHVWEIEEAESKLLAPLWLSYHDLPTKMRPCFLYCAIFPKDYTFQRDELIKLWMAQGFLRETQNQEMEATGGECFEALAARSFFQDFEKDEDGGRIIRCKMHDMVHDFAQSMTKNESFSVEIDGGPAESKIGSFSRDARNSMVVFRNNGAEPYPATIHSFIKLRSLIVGGSPASMNAALPNLIDNLTCLRTLKLSRCGIEEVPSNIGKLLHLRHVDLSCNAIKELPEEMCELYNMQTLDVSVNSLEKLPDSIGKLIKLRYLSVWACSSFVKMRGFEGLGCLRELDEFHVSGRGEGSNIGGLKNLNHLQGYLWIKWLGDVKDPDEVKKAELKNKKNLTQLALMFGSRRERRIIRDDEILEALEAPPNIDSLEIGDYQGIIQVLPSWINNNKLRVVTLEKWRKIENLPSLGKMPFLEDLHLGYMESVRKVGSEFLGMEAAAGDDDNDISIGEMTPSPSNTIIAFPSLKTLWFVGLRKWEEWEGERRRNEDKTIMPSLRSLFIHGCPKLKALPDYIYQSTTLEELQIVDSPILEEQFKEGGKGWPNTSHTPNITFEHASGKKFQEILEEAIVRPLNIGGELYVGFPPGVESRLASLTVDKEDFSKLSKIAGRPERPSTFQPENISQLATVVPALFNMLNVRRAIIPSANGHCSARALARYYAALVDGGLVPPPHSSLSKPPLGTHLHNPKFPSEITSKKQKGKKAMGFASKKKGNGYELKMNHSKDFKDGDNGRESNGDGYTRLVNDNTGGSSSDARPPKGFAASENSRQNNVIEIFNSPRIHDELMGVGGGGGPCHTKLQLYTVSGVGELQLHSDESNPTMVSSVLTNSSFLTSPTNADNIDASFLMKLLSGGSYTVLSLDFIYAEYVMAAGNHHRSIVWQIAEDYSHCEFLISLTGFCPSMLVHVRMIPTLDLDIQCFNNPMSLCLFSLELRVDDVEALIEMSFGEKEHFLAALKILIWLSSVSVPAFRDVIDVPLVVRGLHKTHKEPSGWKLKEEYLPSGWLCLVCGASDSQELPPNFIKLAKDAYTPDLIAASDCMLGKIGYGTVSEALAFRLPFVLVRREYFNEEPFLRNMPESSLAEQEDCEMPLFLGYQLQRVLGRDISIPEWYSSAENELNNSTGSPATQIIENGSLTSTCTGDFEILHGDLQGLPDTKSFSKSLAELDTVYDPEKNTKRRQIRERKATAGLFNWKVSYGSELSNRGLTFDMDLSDFMDGEMPTSYDKAKKYFAQDPSQKWAAYVAGTILVLMTELGVRFEDSISVLD
ncbi:hypothetical protein SADUNF_SadunfUnG0007900 [Salix dunnii]|uniref:Uncharacterized protein n=1 Tax=Salix dunnii TaxID=1413687 RepID=A0A835J000_9ROSI|nr:hypothetical protein SADUNF_SadunfUnG0007900 [Salix dunnii]